MGIGQYPPAAAAASSPIKSVQRGSAAGSGNVTISSVDITKAFVNIFGTASSGTAAASLNMSTNSGTFNLYGIGGMNVTMNNNTFYIPSASSATTASQIGSNPGNASWTYTATVNSGSTTVGSGSTNLVAGVVSGYLSNSTTLVVTGACRYEIVEYV
mgnify:CR=1 FL=1